VEHVLAALWAEGVDNAIIDVDGPEVPVMDGSALAWTQALRAASTVRQRAARLHLCVRKPVEVSHGDRRARLQPADSLSVHCEIDFDHPLIGRQAFSMPLTGEVFRSQLSPARTFGFLHELDGLRARGLGLGASYENAVVLDGARILNSDGLRYPDEFVRHKVLDALGDLYLLGGPVVGALTLMRTGHALHHGLARALWYTEGAFEWVPARDIAPRTFAHTPLEMEQIASSARGP
jgi:UDP-3-O-[3-hydroxymyristoyl] N-acetylglucosamine deacetylase